ncbi:hypothetical protein ACOME3_008716 [Neoechinorhynchus agilis]
MRQSRDSQHNSGSARYNRHLSSRRSPSLRSRLHPRSPEYRSHHHQRQDTRNNSPPSVGNEQSQDRFRAIRDIFGASLRNFEEPHVQPTQCKVSRDPFLEELGPHDWHFASDIPPSEVPNCEFRVIEHRSVRMNDDVSQSPFFVAKGSNGYSESVPLSSIRSPYSSPEERSFACCDNCSRGLNHHAEKEDDSRDTGMEELEDLNLRVLRATRKEIISRIGKIEKELESLDAEIAILRGRKGPLNPNCRSPPPPPPPPVEPFFLSMAHLLLLLLVVNWGDQ